MRYEDQRRSDNVRDRRGMGGKVAMGGARVAGAIPMVLLRLLFSRMGRKTLLPILVIGVAAYFMVPQVRDLVNAQLSAMLSGTGAAPSGQAAESGEPYEGTPEEERLADFTAAVLGSTEDVWTALYAADGKEYRAPELVLYTDGTQTECGYGSSQIGPFYCPPDENVYIDLSFFEAMGRQLNAPGDFAQAYVVAHEVGHHVQKLEGVLDWSTAEKRSARSEAERNQVQVRVELMADCLAGVWAGLAEGFSAVELEPGDLREAINAAEAVGDDTLQRRAGQSVVPDAFQHGSADQRMRWFQTGYETTDPDTCETRTIPYDDL